jgi:hypothetical protein
VHSPLIEQLRPGSVGVLFEQAVHGSLDAVVVISSQVGRVASITVDCKPSRY